MRNLFTQLAKAILLLALIVACFGVNAQRRYAPLGDQDFNFLLENMTQTSTTTFTFDLYLLDTDASQPMEFASCQAGLNVNTGIYNGGTMTCQIIAGYSDLPTSLQPTSVQFTQSVNLIKLAGKTPPGAGNGPILATTGYGTRVCRLQVTDSNPFTAGSSPNFTFTSSTAVSPSYATRLAIYYGGLNTQLTVTPGTNALVQSNVVLNAPAPSAYTVGGTGSYCQGGGGLTVTLSGSQTGVSYQLYQNGSAFGGSVAGTGSGLSWTGELAGTYTIVATGVTGYVGTTTMTGSAIVTMNPLPDAAGAISGSATVVQGTSGVAYSVGAINNATSYAWSYTGTGFTFHNGTTNNLTIDFASNATSGDLAVYGVNSCGNGTISANYSITLQAAIHTWTGAISTDWFTAGNWSPATVPGATDDVTIPVVTNQPLVAGGTLAQCKNAEVQAGATITVTGMLTVNQMTTLDGGLNLIVNNGSFIDSGITGSGTESFMKTMTTNHWHYVSSPISNGTAAIFLNDYLVNYYTPNNAWGQYILIPSTPMNVMQGYASYDVSAVKTFAGNFNTGTKTIGVIPQSVPTAGTGYNLVGNCYPSALDLGSSGITWADASHTCWFWDPVNQTYNVYLNAGPLPSHTQYVPAVQAFFTESTVSSNFGVSNAARVHNSEAFLKDGSVYPNALSIKATSQVNGYVDEAVVGFNPATTTGYDVNYDAAKLEGGTDAPQIYSILYTGQKVAYNVQPVVDANTVVPMGFTSGINGSMTLNASNLESFDASVSIYLEDLKEGTMQNLKSNPAYSFDYTTGDNANRFVLHFSNPTGINEHSTGIQVYSFDNSVYIRNLSTQQMQNVFVYDLLGKEVFHSALNQNPLQKYTLNVNEGYYLVKVISDKGVTTQKVYIN